MDLTQELAREAIADFRERFGLPHLHLAYHAAFPLALSPDLLYHIWANFQRDMQGTLLDIPWVAVADILLSPFCREIRQEVYRMDEAVRLQLINALHEELRFRADGRERIVEVAEFLQQYVSANLQSPDRATSEFAEAQQWTALAYTQPHQLVASLAEAYRVKGLSRPHLLRLAALLDTFATPITTPWVATPPEVEAEYDRLHSYGASLAAWTRGNTTQSTRQLRRLLGPATQLEIAGFNLPLPPNIAQETQRWAFRIMIESEATVRCSYYHTETLISELRARFNFRGGLKTQIEQLARNLEDPSFSRTPSRFEETASILGEALFEALFDDISGPHFLRAYEATLSAGGVLSIELEIDAKLPPGVAALPWELLRVPANTITDSIWLATSPQLALSRRVQSWIPTPPIRLRANEKLRVALVVSDPRDLGALQSERLLDGLNQLAADHSDYIAPPILVNPATPEAIDELLKNQRPHIFHFMGHGRVGNERDKAVGQLALMNQRGEVIWMSVGQFGQLFVRHRPGVVLLPVFGGVMENSAELVRQGIAAVVATRYDIPNVSFIRFAREFYRRFIQGLPIDEAVQAGRRAIALGAGYERPDFAAPAIVTSLPTGTGVIWAPDSPLQEQAPEPAPPLSDTVAPPGLAESKAMLDDLTEEVSRRRASDPAAAALQDLRMTRIAFSHPEGQLLRLTPERFAQMGVPLNDVQRAQFDKLDFYFLSLTILLNAKPAVVFTSLECELNFGPKGSNQPIVQALFPQAKWQSVLRVEALTLGLDGNLDWKIGVEKDNLAEITSLSRVPNTDIQDEDELKAYVVIPDYSFNLGRTEIAATGEGGSIAHWRINQPALRESQRTSFSVVFKVPKGTEEIELEGLVVASTSLNWLTSNLTDIFSELTGRFQRFLQREKGPQLGQREWWTLKLPRDEG